MVMAVDLNPIGCEFKGNMNFNFQYFDSNELNKINSIVENRKSSNVSLHCDKFPLK